MRHILTAAALLSSALIVPTAAQAQRAPNAVVVVVDTDRVYRDCNACRTATASLTSQRTALQTRDRTLGEQLRPEAQRIQTALEALNGKEPDAALRGQIEAFQKRQQAAAQEIATAQRNLQSISAHVIRQIDQRLNPVINQVMTQRGANLAVSVDATLAHAAAVNVTDAVLAALNTALPAVSLTPLPQPQQPAQPQQQQPQGR